MQALHVPAKWSLVAAVAAAAAYAAAVVAAPVSGNPPTFFAATSTWAAIAEIVAGFSLLGAGLLVLVQARRPRVALLVIAAGVLWFGPRWEGWSGGPALLRSLGALTAPLFLAVVVHLTVSLRRAGVATRSSRAAVTGAYAVAALAMLARAVARDPLLDLYCWRNCLANTFLIGSNVGLTHKIGVLYNGALLALALLLVATATVRTARRPRSHVPAAAIVVGLVWATYAAVLLDQPLEDPARPLFRSLFLATALATVALAAAIAWYATRSAQMRVSLVRLANDLRSSPRPGEFEDALSEALRDPSLRVGYKIARLPRFVDSEGRPFDDAPSHGWVSTPIKRRSDTIAVVIHDEQIDIADLDREIGAAARLAIDNERFRAQALAQLDSLRASRARIVVVGDRARRQLEHGLHDGAQQRLLALSYQVRIAKARAHEVGDSAVATALTRSESHAAQALDDLRTLAHGIYPAVLEDTGLYGAFGTLADTANVAVVLDNITQGRFHRDVEAAAYIVAAEAIQDAAARGATFARLAATAVRNSLTVSVSDDGRPRTGSLVHVVDRVGALGGEVEFEATRLRAEIPCV